MNNYTPTVLRGRNNICMPQSRCCFSQSLLVKEAWVPKWEDVTYQAFISWARVEFLQMCPHDNLQCHKWWQSWHHGNSPLSVIHFQASLAYNVFISKLIKPMHVTLKTTTGDYMIIVNTTRTSPATENITKSYLSKTPWIYFCSF